MRNFERIPARSLSGRFHVLLEDPQETRLHEPHHRAPRLPFPLPVPVGAGSEVSQGRQDSQGDDPRSEPFVEGALGILEHVPEPVQVTELMREVRPDLVNRLPNPLPHVRDHSQGTAERLLQTAQERGDPFAPLALDHRRIQHDARPPIPGHEDHGTALAERPVHM